MPANQQDPVSARLDMYHCLHEGPRVGRCILVYCLHMHVRAQHDLRAYRIDVAGQSLPAPIGRQIIRRHAGVKVEAPHSRHVPLSLQAAIPRV